MARLNKQNIKKIKDLKEQYLMEKHAFERAKVKLETELEPYLDDAYPDPHELLEIRQLLLELGPSPVLDKVIDKLRQCGYVRNGVDVPDVLEPDVRESIKTAVKEYRITKDFVDAMEITIQKYANRILNRNDTYRDCEYLAELIEALPACMFQYKLMKQYHICLNKKSS